MNRFIGIIIRIAIAVGLAGCVLFLIGKAFGGSQHFSINISNLGTKVYGDKDIVKGEINVDAFGGIDVSVASIDVNICKGDSFRVEYSCPEVLIPEVNVTNGILYLKQPNVKGGINYSLSTQTFIGYTIYIPDDSVYHVVINGSSAEIFVDSVNISGEITTSSGDVVLNNCSGQNVSLAFTSGCLKLEECTFDSSKFDGSSGDVLLVKCNIASVNAGLSSGILSISESKINEISAEASSGDIILTTNDIKSMNLKTSSGDVNIEANGIMNNYAVEINTSSGTINVGNISAEDRFSINEGADKTISCKTSSGDVRISFDE